MKSISPRVTKPIFGALIVAGSLLAAAGVVFATPEAAHPGPQATCPAQSDGTDGP
ncbi:hypothetical protein GCM10009734_80460 [Nonomuraea bangladeshensis]